MSGFQVTVQFLVKLKASHCQCGRQRPPAREWSDNPAQIPSMAGNASARNSAGYSGTPLARKLGITAGMHVHVDNPPPDYRQWLEPLPEAVVFESTPSLKTGLAHFFVDRRARLESALQHWRQEMPRDSAIWISWPKKASKVATDITEDVIREVALPLGMVDIKVCAVSEVWSGLKLVIRKELR
jgi:hypothetical protein